MSGSTMTGGGSGQAFYSTHAAVQPHWDQMLFGPGHVKDSRCYVGTRMAYETDPGPESRHELFLLADGEEKVTYEAETRVPNAMMFTFNKEDHTLGNLLRAKLVKSPHVLFAAYQVPHPLFAVFKLRVQTDGEISPKEAVVQACQELVKELSMLDQEFTKEWELKKIAGEGMGA